MKKQVKNHRYSLDFDIKFGKAIMRTVGKGEGIGNFKPVSVPGRKRQKTIKEWNQKDKIECKL